MSASEVAPVAAVAPVTSPGLSRYARFFAAKPTPRIIGSVLVTFVVARVLVGGWSRHDAIVAGVVLGIEPISEWVIHVFVLHFRPRRVGGLRIDLHAAKKHREHHLDPHDPDTAFIPLPDLVGLAVIALTIIGLSTRSLPTFLTGACTAFAMLLTYEWTHYLIHTPYRPRGRYYRYIWRAHRLHHFKNQHYWFGVTIHLADHLLRTFPKKSAVETSPTARTLGIDIR